MLSVADLDWWKGAPPKVWTLPPYGGSGGNAASRGVWGQSPQKLKPKNTLEASQKHSGDVKVMCIVDNSLLIFAQFLYLQRDCANLTEYKKLHHNRCIINIKNLRMTLPKGGARLLRPSLNPPLVMFSETCTGLVKIPVPCHWFPTGPWKALKFQTMWQQQGRSENPTAGSDWQASILWKQCGWHQSGILQSILMKLLLRSKADFFLGTGFTRLYQAVSVVLWSGVCWKGISCKLNMQIEADIGDKFEAKQLVYSHIAADGGICAPVGAPVR